MLHDQHLSRPKRCEGAGIVFQIQLSHCLNEQRCTARFRYLDGRAQPSKSHVFPWSSQTYPEIAHICLPYNVGCYATRDLSSCFRLGPQLESHIEQPYPALNYCSAFALLGCDWYNKPLSSTPKLQQDVCMPLFGLRAVQHGYTERTVDVQGRGLQ
jgi:hypothetical protein